MSVDAGSNSRVFNVDDGTYNNDFVVAIKGLTITNGRGGIGNGENLTIINSMISGNPPTDASELITVNPE